MDNASEPFLRSLELIRDTNQWSIAEMARRADLPKRSMENYFKGHKPGLDALVAMARGFGVTVDFLTGRALDPAAPTDAEEMVFEAAFPTILSIVRRFRHYTQEGRNVFGDGTVFSIPLEQFVEEEAREIVRRFNVTRSHFSETVTRERRTLPPQAD